MILSPTFLLTLALGQAPTKPEAPRAAVPVLQPAPGDPLRDVRETHLRGVVQLTREGSNAEAYWSFSGRQIVFQSTRDGWSCDQLYAMNADGTGVRRISNGTGRVTCGYFLPGDRTLVFASTHGAAPGCPEAPPFTPGTYRWPVFPGYDLHLADADGRNIRPFLPSPGYDAEATVAPGGGFLVFTSERGGDIDIWRADLDGRNLKRLTDRIGYDGGAVVSPDGSKIAWRTNYPEGEAQVARYKELLAQHLVEPMAMDIWIMDADGGNKRQLTRLPGAAFAPIFSPDGKWVVFSSNHHDNEGKGRGFELYRVRLDGSGLERLTWSGVFNSFPHFSPDGKRLLFISGRLAASPRQFNVFSAGWVE